MTFRQYRPLPSSAPLEESKGFAGLQHRKPTEGQKLRAGNASKKRAKSRELDAKLDELLGPVGDPDDEP